MLKAALENPVNPNEPKGLGTAATRDTILPKLQKSQYVELLKGKDPPIQVTEIGLAFIAAVRRVFPSYGDPVGRAMFEADLAEIGRAGTRNDPRPCTSAFCESYPAITISVTPRVRRGGQKSACSWCYLVCRAALVFRSHDEGNGLATWFGRHGRDLELLTARQRAIVNSKPDRQLRRVCPFYAMASPRRDQQVIPSFQLSGSGFALE